MKVAGKVVRFGVSMPKELAAGLDGLVAARGYASRSQAVGELVQAALVEDRARTGAGWVAGTVSLSYDHHRRNLLATLTDIQHDHGALIVAALHVHLDHHACMEVLAVRGRAGEVKAFTDRLLAVKGVHGRLTLASAAPAPKKEGRHAHG